MVITVHDIIFKTRVCSMYQQKPSSPLQSIQSDIFFFPTGIQLFPPHYLGKIIKSLLASSPQKENCVDFHFFHEKRTK